MVDEIITSVDTLRDYGKTSASSSDYLYICTSVGNGRYVSRKISLADLKEIVNLSGDGGSGGGDGGDGGGDDTPVAGVEVYRGKVAASVGYGDFGASLTCDITLPARCTVTIRLDQDESNLRGIYVDGKKLGIGSAYSKKAIGTYYYHYYFSISKGTKLSILRSTNAISSGGALGAGGYGLSISFPYAYYEDAYVGYTFPITVENGNLAGFNTSILQKLGYEITSAGINTNVEKSKVTITCQVVSKTTGIYYMFFTGSITAQGDTDVVSDIDDSKGYANGIYNSTKSAGFAAFGVHSATQKITVKNFTSFTSSNLKLTFVQLKF